MAEVTYDDGAVCMQVRTNKICTAMTIYCNVYHIGYEYGIYAYLQRNEITGHTWSSSIVLPLPSTHPPMTSPLVHIGHTANSFSLSCARGSMFGRKGEIHISMLRARSYPFYFHFEFSKAFA